MKASGAIRSIVLEGSPRERGRTHGETLRPVITQGVQRWKESISAATGLRPAEYIEQFVESTNFMPAIERWALHLLEEVRGIAEGAALSFRDGYAYQLMDEEWSFRTDARRASFNEPLEHCSMVGCFSEGSGPTLLAQNMDLPGYYDGTQTLLHIKHQDQELESLVFSAAGLLGTTGLNNLGIGVCVNTLAQLRHTSGGLPVAYIVRRLLESRSLEEATTFVQGVTHASGQNYAIGDMHSIVDFECSANKAVQFTTGPTRIYHTNHPLANDDQIGRNERPTASVASGGSETQPQADASPLSNSEQRYAFLACILGEGSSPITVDAVKSILRTTDVPISVARKGNDGGMTLGSLIMELSIPPVLHVAAGPPAETDYTRWTFQAIAQPVGR
ncbi:MAG: family cysteine protease [Chloroflexi bacterium]|jgi:isopenicillin-N N-acyltransferase-like protein|nr:family cysteine protease [Chloroflexota bacterium]MDB5074717.1 family cysteine protease [Chloroflexota bacterium]